MAKNFRTGGIKERAVFMHREFIADNSPGKGEAFHDAVTMTRAS
jgi:hypothetical protein